MSCICSKSPAGCHVQFGRSSTVSSVTLAKFRVSEQLVCYFLVNDDVHQLPRPTSVVLSPKVSLELRVPDLSCNLTGEPDASIVVNEHDITGHHLFPPRFVHRSWDRTNDTCSLSLLVEIQQRSDISRTRLNANEHWTKCEDFCRLGRSKI